MMHPKVRSGLAVVAGFIAWFMVATAANLVLRAGVPGYADAEPSMQFSLPMLWARLGVGAVSSVLAGAACMSLARHAAAAKVLAVVLVVFFIPVHAGLWARFPLWYHATFLVSLAPLVLAGARMVRRMPTR